MNQDFDTQLCANYPKIFTNNDIQTFGIECGDGWYKILDALCGNILHDNLSNTPIPNEIQQVVVSQVKEKFGALRFYYDGGDEVIEGMVRLAETMSECTCETCGGPGKLRGTKWMYTACDNHAKDNAE